MSSLLYEIATDVLEMPGILCEYGYWQMRVWGFTERDMVHGTFAAASLVAVTLVSAACPERPSVVPQAAMVLVPISRAVRNMHEEGWFLMLRLVFIGVCLVLIGSIILSAPELLSQDKFHASQFFDQEVRIRAMEINDAKLDSRLDNITAQVAEIKENIIWARNAMFTLLGGVAIFLIKEFLMLLKGILPGKSREE